MHGIKILDNYKPSLTIVTPNGNVVIDLLTAEIEFQGDVLPNEAARTFWNEMKIVGESLTEQLAKAVAEAERLRELQNKVNDKYEKHCSKCHCQRESFFCKEVCLFRFFVDNYAGLEG